jgi:hypothetical protein
MNSMEKELNFVEMEVGYYYYCYYSDFHYCSKERLKGEVVIEWENLFVVFLNN